MDFTNMVDLFDITTQISRLLKKAPYGKLDVSLITQNAEVIQAEINVTNKILIRKNQNALFVLSAEIVRILEEQINGKFTVEFCFKNKEVYKLIIKYTKPIEYDGI
jgi:hypothetical protein